MDPELLEAVLGRKTDTLKTAPAWLSGYVAQRAAGYPFPTLIEDRRGRVDGVIVQGLSEEDVARIAYFEDEEYAPGVVDVATAESEIAAQAFLATPRLQSSGEAWSFETWRKHDRPLVLAITRKMMTEHYGVTPISGVDAVWRRLKEEIESEFAPTLTQARRRTPAAKPAQPRRAKRAASPKRLPQGS